MDRELLDDVTRRLAGVGIDQLEQLPVRDINRVIRGVVERYAATLLPFLATPVIWRPEGLYRLLDRDGSVLGWRAGERPVWRDADIGCTIQLPIWRSLSAVAADYEDPCLVPELISFRVGEQDGELYVLENRDALLEQDDHFFQGPVPPPWIWTLMHCMESLEFALLLPLRLSAQMRLHSLKPN